MSDPSSDPREDMAPLTEPREDLDAAQDEAQEEAEAAHVTPGAVMRSTPEGYATGAGKAEFTEEDGFTATSDGAVQPPADLDPATPEGEDYQPAEEA